MRNGWEYKKFETCINKVPKAKQVKTNDYNTGTKYPIVSQEDKLISGYYDDESMVYHIDSPVIIFGDHTRVLKYVDFDFVVGADGVKIISPKKELNAKFLLYYLTWYKIPNLGYSRHYKLLKDLDIPIPPKSTQLAIVSELDKINELIRLKKEQLIEYDNLAQSIFYDMFGDPVENEMGWEVKKLIDVCTKITDGTHDTPQRLTEGVKFITGKHIRPGYIDYMNSDYVTEQVHKEIYARCNPEFGDVLYTNIGANLANAAINTVHYEFSMKNVALLKLRKDVIHGMLLQFYLNNPRIREKILENYSNGGAQKFLSLKSIALIKTILPPLPLQQSFASRIEQIEKLKSEVQNAITDLETLLASRMQYWFE